MVKTGIIGADSPLAGELIRILINHPETDIVTLYAPARNGRSVSSLHYGLIGESLVNFTDKINPEDLDLIFITDNSETGVSLLENLDKWPELRVVDLSPERFFAQTSKSLEYGLSEINRKALVRGARHAVIPSTPAAVALVALHPLARFLLLNSSLEIELSMPEDQFKEIKDMALIREELSQQLKKIQSSFGEDIKISVLKTSTDSRYIELRTVVDCSLPIDEIAKIYDNIYDDHNFTFISLTPVSRKEVEGTQKIVISLNKTSSGKLEIYAVADSRLRGGAGDAVHMLNLLFSLHEKTGLYLKSTSFGLPDEQESASSSWFA